MNRDRDTFDMFQEPERGRFGDNESEARRGRATVSSGVIDLALVLHHETHPGNPDAGAVLVSDNGDENRAEWVPKSLCQFERKRTFVQGTTKAGKHVKFEEVTLTTQTWVAKDKGLV